MFQGTIFHEENQNHPTTPCQANQQALNAQVWHFSIGLSILHPKSHETPGKFGEWLLLQYPEGSWSNSWKSRAISIFRWTHFHIVSIDGASESYTLQMFNCWLGQPVDFFRNAANQLRLLVDSGSKSMIFKKDPRWFGPSIVPRSSMNGIFTYVYYKFKQFM